MASTRYDIIRYRPELKVQVVELLQYLWNANTDINAVYFAWKYEQNPYSNAPLIYLALCNGCVVGMRGLVGARWSTGSGRPLLDAPLATDLIIHPEHRNRSLVTQIMHTASTDLIQSGYTHLLNLSATPVTRLASLAMGWRSAGTLPIMQWVPPKIWRGWRRLLRYSISRLPPGSYQAPDVLDVFDRNAARRRGKVHVGVSAALVPQPGAMAQLAQRTSHDGYMRHVKDEAYFAWRLCNPSSRYRFLFWESCRLEGYVVIQLPRHRDRESLAIVDWEAARADILRDLIQAVIQWGNAHPIILWATAGSPEFHTVFLELGFQLAPIADSHLHSRPHILVKSLHDHSSETDVAMANPDLVDLANWDVRMIYSDAF